jgi:hypothetical protein
MRKPLQSLDPGLEDTAHLACLWMLTKMKRAEIDAHLLASHFQDSDVVFEPLHGVRLLGQRCACGRSGRSRGLGCGQMAEQQDSCEQGDEISAHHQHKSARVQGALAYLRLASAWKVPVMRGHLIGR